MHRNEVFSFVRPFPIIPAAALCCAADTPEVRRLLTIWRPGQLRGDWTFLGFASDRRCGWPKRKLCTTECYEWRDSGAVGMLSLSWASLHSVRFIMSFFRRKGKEVLRSMMKGWSPDSGGFSGPMLSSWPHECDIKTLLLLLWPWHFSYASLSSAHRLH